jgi:hypothetical protein
VNDEEICRVERFGFDRLDVDPGSRHPGSRGSQPRRTLGMKRTGVVP